MPQRNLLQYLLVTSKGLAMGAADVVPGVSGGTIAFISGIYEELIETINNLNFKFFKIWKNEGFLPAWKRYNLSFLLSLGLGIAISIFSLANIILNLLETYPIAVWSFFFGLVVASIVYIGIQITNWKTVTIAALVIASVLSYLITVTKPIGSPDSNWFLFFAGFVAIIAMILPGISGAFILLLIGAYTNVMGIVTQLLDGIATMDFEVLSEAVLKMLIFLLGAITGIKVFSGALNWMFKHKKNITLSILTGFMVGALNKIWPWKKVMEYRTNSVGEQVPFIEQSILPHAFDGNPHIFSAILFAVIGFLIIFLLEWVANRKLKS